ncbi:MAG: TetR/AcrR family transcriptional regulator [Candidatus Wallbacteria bacterium]|nr:TetR/AcrR family transcriptional regulator [Candidatus Wallbacteria bacterium]
MRKLSESTRDAVLAATAKLLAKREFASLRTREIAAAAGVAEATLFRYFRKKDQIIEAIISEKGEQLFRDIEEAVRLVDSPREKLLAVLRQHAHFACRFRDIIIVCQRQHGLSRKSAIPAGFRRWLDTLQGILQSGVDKGVFRPDLDIRATSLALHSVPTTLFLQERVYYQKPMNESAFLEAAEYHYQLLLRALEPAPPRR